MGWILDRLLAWLASAFTWLWELFAPSIYAILGFCLQVLVGIVGAVLWLVNVVIYALIVGLDMGLYLVNSFGPVLLQYFGINTVTLFSTFDNQLLALIQNDSQGWFRWFLGVFFYDTFRVNFLLTLNILLCMFAVRLIMRIVRG